MGISLSGPHQPKPMLQPLPTMLRMSHVAPIRNCSKAPGVFSSNYRYPASSPEVHFHRASPRDSPPVITPFVHVGIYPTRNCAHLFPTMDHFFTHMGCAAYGLSCEPRICYALLHNEVALNDIIFSELFTVSYNRPNPFRIRLLRRGTLGRL